MFKYTFFTKIKKQILKDMLLLFITIKLDKKNVIKIAELKTIGIDYIIVFLGEKYLTELI